MDTDAVRNSDGSPSMLLFTASIAACWSCGSIVVVICSPAVFRSCSLMPDDDSSRNTCVLINPLGPASVASPLLTDASGRVAGYCMADRAPWSSAPMVTMPSST